jgi:hypothetical protein
MTERYPSIDFSGEIEGNPSLHNIQLSTDDNTQELLREINHSNYQRQNGRIRDFRWFPGRAYSENTTFTDEEFVITDTQEESRSESFDVPNITSTRTLSFPNVSGTEHLNRDHLRFIEGIHGREDHTTTTEEETERRMREVWGQEAWNAIYRNTQESTIENLLTNTIIQTGRLSEVWNNPEDDEFFEPIKRPLNEELLKYLHKEEYSETCRFSDCCICLEDYDSKEEVYILPCEHTYHPDCIKLWFKERRTCPMCNSDAMKPLELLAQESS